MANISSITICNNSSLVGSEVSINLEMNREKEAIRKILDLPSVDGFEICHAYKSLRMVHYLDDADMCIYGSVRGTLVDLETGAVLAPSFGYTHTAVTSQLKSINGKITVQDTNGNEFVYDQDSVVISTLLDGVTLRVIWYNNEMLVLSHRKINPKTSFWGSSPNFLSLYHAAGGPPAEKLFDTTKKFSNSCYIFSAVDASLLIATRQDVRAPYLAFLDKIPMVINCDERDIADGIASFDTCQKISSKVMESCIYQLKNLSVAEANHHLSFGYYNPMNVSDVREQTGEAIVLYTMENGRPVNVVKVHSLSYDWRFNMRGNDPNIGHRFYSLLDDVYINTDEQLKTFQTKYILYPLYNQDWLFQSYMSQGCKLLTLPVFEYDKTFLKNKTVRIYILWLNYLMSLPIPHQLSCLSLFDDFMKDRESLVSWLSDFKVTVKDVTQLSPRCNNLITVSTQSAEKTVASGRNYRNGAYIGLSVLLKNNIRNFIHKEKGISLYKLIKEMKKEQTEIIPSQ
jgi:hypothetical protein